MPWFIIEATPGDARAAYGPFDTQQLAEAEVGRRKSGAARTFARNGIMSFWIAESAVYMEATTVESTTVTKREDTKPPKP